MKYVGNVALNVSIVSKRLVSIINVALDDSYHSV
jgi:hypothetical protein